MEDSRRALLAGMTIEQTVMAKGLDFPVKPDNDRCVCPDYDTTQGRESGPLFFLPLYCFFVVLKESFPFFKFSTMYRPSSLCIIVVHVSMEHFMIDKV